MKNMTRNNLGTLMAGVMLASLSSGHAVIIIDHFDSPSALSGGQSTGITNGIAGTWNESYQTGLSVLGGTRDIYIRVENIYAAGNAVAASANGVTSPDYFTYSNDANVESTCQIRWDAGGFGMNADLSAEDSFVLFTAYNDIPTAYTLAISTFGAGGGTSTRTINTGVNYNGDLAFNFSDFSAGANIADVDSITLSINGGRSVDVSLHSLTVVPEVSSAGLAILGVAALGLRRRRA